MHDESKMPARAGVYITRVSKSYGTSSGDTVEALRPVSLDIEPGEFVALIGPSGCGKSTLLNIVAGFEAPSAGTVQVDGERVTRPDIRRGMVFQQYALFPWLSVRDNVAFGLRQKGVPRGEREAIAQRYLDLGACRSSATRARMRCRAA